VLTKWKERGGLASTAARSVAVTVAAMERIAVGLEDVYVCHCR
jgi:hypothetical protein